MFSGVAAYMCGFYSNNNLNFIAAIVKVSWNQDGFKY